MKGLRVGYSFWGFLGDNKYDTHGNRVSTPDGNATYSWSIIWEAMRRGYTVHAMQDDRDWTGWKIDKEENFASFSKEKRTKMYLDLKHTFGSSEIMPELDVLLVEWRFPIPGRNCIADDPNAVPGTGSAHPGGYWIPNDMTGLQPDLLRQNQILSYYKNYTKTKIIFWDLDHKLTARDEEGWKPDAVFETSVTPRKLIMERTRVEPPFHIPDLLQHPTLPSDPNRKLVYIGSRYERDDVITEWVKPTSNQYPNGVEFHGNWLKTLDECKKLWPNVAYHDRCTTKDFRQIYGTAVACPLLAKKSYLETGFITPRPWEALLFGTLPVGLNSAKGIREYTNFIAYDGEDMTTVVEHMSRMDVQHKDECRRELVEKLEFMDAKHFLDKMEAVLGV